MHPAESNPLHELCHDWLSGSLPPFEPFRFDACDSTDSFVQKAEDYLKTYDDIRENAAKVNCYVNQVLWGTPFTSGSSTTGQGRCPASCSSTTVEAKQNPFVKLKLKVYNATCDRSSPEEVEEWATCSDCTCWAPGCPGSVQCYGSSSAECQEAKPVLDVTEYSDGTTCCKSKFARFNCTEVPRQPAQYSNDQTTLISDGYEIPYISSADFENFVDPNSENWGKLVIKWPIAYMREQAGLENNEDEVFVRGIAAYLEGATVDLPTREIKVTLTPTGQMTNQVRKPGDPNDGCNAASCFFDDYSFTGAPSNKAPNTLTYEASYRNTNCKVWSKYCDTSDGTCDGLGANNRYLVFGTGGYRSSANEEESCDLGSDCEDSAKECACYCVAGKPYEESYEDPGALAQSGYNQASLFSSYELVVTSDGDDETYDGGKSGIKLQGVTAIHVGFWLKTTSAPKSGESQCADINDKCIPVE